MRWPHAKWQQSQVALANVALRKICDKCVPIVDIPRCLLHATNE